MKAYERKMKLRLNDDLLNVWKRKALVSEGNAFISLPNI